MGNNSSKKKQNFKRRAFPSKKKLGLKRRSFPSGTSKNQQSYHRRTFTVVQDRDSDISDDDNLSSFSRTFKVLVLGSFQTGKTSFVNSVIGEPFSTVHPATIGVSFASCTPCLDEKYIKSQLFDTPGHRRYQQLVTTHYRDAMGVFIIFDVTKEESFLDVSSFLKEVRTCSLPNIPVILIGNKCDRLESRVVTFERAKNLSDEASIPYIEVSCKDGSNVEFAHVSLLALISKRVRDVNSVESTTILT